MYIELKTFLLSLSKEKDLRSASSGNWYKAVKFRFPTYTPSEIVHALKDVFEEHHDEEDFSANKEIKLNICYMVQLLDAATFVELERKTERTSHKQMIKP